jgi:hypothetical protein
VELSHPRAAFVGGKKGQRLNAKRTYFWIGSFKWLSSIIVFHLHIVVVGLIRIYSFR